MKKARIVYITVFGVLLLIEIFIGLFVHDSFIRPYVGDLLVTVLLCCLCKAVVPNSARILPVYVFAFATLVEVAQFFNFLKILGLQNNTFLSVVVGTTFSWVDIVCYGVGCLLFWITEKAIFHCFVNRPHNPS